jgi:predicted nucleotidyltransferase
VQFGLTEDDLSTLQRVFRRYPSVHEVLVFGSRAMGRFRPGSDVDLAVREDDARASALPDMRYELDEETLLPYRFDVLALDQIASPLLVDHIQRWGCSIYRRGE